MDVSKDALKIAADSLIDAGCDLNTEE